MRSQIIGLLAVLSACAAAGPVRHRGAFVHHNRFPRFYNTSAIPSTSDDVQTLTPPPISSSSTSSVDLTSEASTTLDASTTAPVQSSSSANTVLGGSSTLGESQIPTTVDAPKYAPTVTATTPSVSSIPSITVAASTASSESEPLIMTSSGVESATQVFGVSTNSDFQSSTFAASSQVPSDSAISSSTTTLASTQSTGNAKSQVDTNSPGLKAAVVQLGASESAEFAPVTAATATTTPTLPGVQYPNAQGGNKAMATGFNQIFAKLTETSACNAHDSNQALACVSGQPASCNSDGKYVLKSCPDGQSCYALPRPFGETGINVECAVPSDAAAKLSAISNDGNSDAGVSPHSSISQRSTVPATGGVQKASTALPQTESVQMPVQRLSSSQQVTTTSQSQVTSETAQSTSKPLPETESVQIPAQRVMSSSQSTPSSQIQTQVPKSQSDVSVSAATQAETIKPSAQGSQSSLQSKATVQSQSGGPAALGDSKPSASLQVESANQPLQTLQTFPLAQATVQPSKVSSIPSSTGSTPVATQIQSAGSSAHSVVTSSAPSNTADPGGPIFSLPGGVSSSLQVSDISLAHETSSAAPSPSALAQQQQTPSLQTSVAPAPHVVQAAPVVRSSAVPVPSPTSAVDSNGAAIFSVESQGGPNTNAGQVVENKIAVGNAKGTPIYSFVTVTVTTTAYGERPTV